MSRWACAAWFAVGCGHAAPVAPPPGTTHVEHAAVADAAADAGPTQLEDDLPRLAQRAVLLFQAEQHALESAGDDCAAAAKQLDQLAIDYADVTEANTHILGAGHEKVKALRAELAKHDEEMDAAAQAIVHSPVMARCSSDPAFARAIDRIGGSP